MRHTIDHLQSNFIPSANLNQFVGYHTIYIAQLPKQALNATNAPKVGKKLRLNIIIV